MSGWMGNWMVKLRMPECGEPCLLVLPDGREIEVYGDGEGLHVGDSDESKLVAQSSPIGGMCLLICEEIQETIKVKPLPPGINIKYGDDIAVVVRDYRDENNPNDIIRVEIDGIHQDWYWYWDGIECEVVETTKHFGEK